MISKLISQKKIWRKHSFRLSAVAIFHTINEQTVKSLSAAKRQEIRLFKSWARRRFSFGTSLARIQKDTFTSSESAKDTLVLISHSTSALRIFSQRASIEPKKISRNTNCAFFTILYFVLVPFGRLIYEYFAHWETCSSYSSLSFFIENSIPHSIDTLFRKHSFIEHPRDGIASRVAIAFDTRQRVNSLSS